MNSKQKKTLLRILVTAGIFAVLLALELTGPLKRLPEWLRFALYFAPYLLIGYDVILRAVRNIRYGNVFEEHFLMSIATLAAFALGALGDGEYPEALTVMLLYQVGELFQSCAVGRSRRSITEMMELVPEFANLERDGGIETVEPEAVHPGDEIVVRPGEKIPLDGIVVDGESFVDTSALTGESVPRRVRIGQSVVSGCINGDAVLKIRVTKEYEDSTVSKVLELVENASSRKARIENFITRFARYYTPVVTVCAVLLGVLLPLLAHVSWMDGVRRACNFLIVSCPCALVISVPLGFFGGIGAASKIGVLVKGSNYLEAAAGITTLVMDKTGTLTRGVFEVTDIIPAEGVTEKELLKAAAHGECFSTHPIARSVKEAYDGVIDASAAVDASEIPGRGISVTYLGKPLLLGNEALMAEAGVRFERCIQAGTVVYAALDGKYLGCIVISDAVKDGAGQAIDDLKRSGVEVVMLTGDRRPAAEAAAKELGIERVFPELLPADKVSEVETIIADSRGGRVGFVGDGINDAPVLMRSDVGFAMGSLGSDAAIEAADIVLMDDEIRKIPATIRIAKKTIGIVRSNVAFALGVKLLILILSALGFASMWAAVFGDVGVAVLCILNSMRALSVKKQY